MPTQTWLAGATQTWDTTTKEMQVVELQEATVDDILKELWTRPMRFVFACQEPKALGFGCVSGHPSMSVNDAIEMFDGAGNYLLDMTLTDDWISDDRADQSDDDA